MATRSAIVSRSPRCIDCRGLHKTNLAALRDALSRVARPGTLCLSDGFRLGDIGYEHRAVIDGDERSAAIAAASILAKVTATATYRADAIHPGWEFAFSTSVTRRPSTAARSRARISPIHRLSFQSIACQQLALDEAEALRA